MAPDVTIKISLNNPVIMTINKKSIKIIVRVFIVLETKLLLHITDLTIIKASPLTITCRQARRETKRESRREVVPEEGEGVVVLNLHKRSEYRRGVHGEDHGEVIRDVTGDIHRGTGDRNRTEAGRTRGATHGVEVGEEGTCPSGLEFPNVHGVTPEYLGVFRGRHVGIERNRH